MGKSGKVRSDQDQLPRLNVGVCVGLFIVWSLFSGGVYGFGQTYLVHRYTGSEGLGNSSVYSMTQDRLGRMWFATRSGISCYDGNSWRTYTPADGLPEGVFSYLETDRTGRIWVLRYILGNPPNLAYFDGSRWHNIGRLKSEIFKTDALSAFQVAAQKGGDPGFPVIAIGTVYNGIFLWNRDNNRTWTQLEKSHGLVDNHVNGIASLEGKFYAATNRGISVIDPGSGGEPVIDNRLSQLPNLPSLEILAVAVQYKDRYPDSALTHPRIWFLGLKWVGYLNENRTGLTHYPVPEEFDREIEGRIKILPDYRCGAYIGGIQRLNYFNSKTLSWETLGTANGLLGNAVNSFFIDAEKNTWLASERGVSKI
ncbi:MAG: hypothetical protein GY940_19180, partial [bacterium]|nr:hypothetical protein [bacterium]